MLYLDLPRSLQFNALSANSSSQSSFLVSLSTTKQTGLGGLVNGTVEGWEPTSCPNQLENSSSRLLSWGYGHPTSSLPTSSSLFLHPSPLFHMPIPSTRRSCVSPYHPSDSVAHCLFSLVASLEANSCTSLLHEGQETEAVDCYQIWHRLPMCIWSDHRSGCDS